MNLPDDLEKALGDRYTIGRQISTGYDGTTCHRLHGRHYHCANCGEMSGYQGHLHGDPPEFKCPTPPESPLAK